MANKRITHRVTAASEIQNRLRFEIRFGWTDAGCLLIRICQIEYFWEFKNTKMRTRRIMTFSSRKLKLNKASKTRFEHRHPKFGILKTSALDRAATSHYVVTNYIHEHDITNTQFIQKKALISNNILLVVVSRQSIINCLTLNQRSIAQLFFLLTTEAESWPLKIYGKVDKNQFDRMINELTDRSNLKKDKVNKTTNENLWLILSINLLNIKWINSAVAYLTIGTTYDIVDVALMMKNGITQISMNIHRRVKVFWRETLFILLPIRVRKCLPVGVVATVAT